MRRTENKFRELRVYKAKIGSRKGINFVFWPVLPWYFDPLSKKGFSWRSKRFAKQENQFMPLNCQGAEFLRTFRKGEIVSFPDSYDPNRKGGVKIKPGESWRICKISESRGEISLLRAHELAEVIHPITLQKVCSEVLDLPFNDFMRAMGYGIKSNELSHSPPAQPESPGAAKA
jgi:hypothetical protein